ncbi:Cullin [Hyaloraphidium curvatum]|nr:Cullin [Hyaloraphidium curvatum]
MSAAGPPRKTAASKIIKPPRKPGLNDASFEEAWRKLSQALKEIFRRNNGQLSYEELYRNAYNMVLHKTGAQLYNGVRNEISDHLVELAQDKIVPLFPQEDDANQRAAFLKAVKETWEHHTVCMGMIRDILMYMDRVYVKTATPPVPEVYNLGMDLFRDLILRSDNISPRIISSMLELIRLERDGDTIDRMILTGISAMMSKLEMPADGDNVGSSVYEMDFEGVFVEKSSEYYGLESERYLALNDVVQYLKKVEQRLAEEDQRVQMYLQSSTRDKIRKVVESQMLEQRIGRIIETENTGLVPQLRDDKFDDLLRMYRLLGLVKEGHNEMRKVLSDYIKELGREINETFAGAPRAGDSGSAPKISAADGAGDGEDEPKGGPATDWAKWVEAILTLKDKFERILERSFAKDKLFQTIMNSAMETVVNRNPKAPEFVSLFIDENLRKGIKGKSEEEVELLLDKTVGLFRFLQDKDVFERYYKQHLAKRLLLGRSLSEDAEKSFVAKLKVECGYQFTSKLEGMFNDMRVSGDLSNEFKNYLGNLVSSNAPNLAEFNVNVLTSTYWPMTISNPAVVTCPPSIESLMRKFSDFYLGRHSGRRLTWVTSMGSADLRASFDKGKKDINLTTYGMVVLCGVFNSEEACDGQPVSFARIREVTSIPDADLKRTLQSLSLGKYRILLKAPMTREVAETDEFRLNTAFTAPLLKIRIPNILPSQSAAATGSGNVVEDDQERAETMEKVEQARGHQVEAAIVRIMKSRKAMTHNELLSEVIRQLSSRFNPSPALIKKRIESLIERDYLERGTQDRRTIHYRA